MGKMDDRVPKPQNLKSGSAGKWEARAKDTDECSQTGVSDARIDPIPSGRHVEGAMKIYVGIDFGVDVDIAKWGACTVE